ncbi:hypothetical protein LguiA_013719 [Lonicera macranthoides]
MAPPSTNTWQPLESNWLMDIIFFRNFGTYATPPKVRSTPSNILIFTIPTPITVHLLPFDNVKELFTCSLNESKYFFLKQI